MVTTPAAPSPEFRVGQRVRHVIVNRTGTIREVLGASALVDYDDWSQGSESWLSNLEPLTPAPEPPKVEESCAACGAVCPQYRHLDAKVCDRCICLCDLQQRIAARRSAPTPAATGKDPWEKVGSFWYGPKGSCKEMADTRHSVRPHYQCLCGFTWDQASLEIHAQKESSKPPAKAAEPDPYQRHRDALVKRLASFGLSGPSLDVVTAIATERENVPDLWKGEKLTPRQRLERALRADLATSTADRKARLRLAGKYDATKWQDWPKGGDDEP